MLPPLPKQNKTKEADFGVTFRHWWEENKLIGTFELKHTRGKGVFYFSELSRDQQVINNKSSKLLRISSGTIGAPDYIGLVNFPAYLVIKFPQSFFIIPFYKINTLISRGKKSITFDECKKCLYPQVNLRQTKYKCDN